MKAEQLVQHSSRLIDAMGRWPSFHDANVLKLSRSDCSCAATIHVFEMTSELDSKGYFVLKKHHLVTLSMHGVRSNSLPEPYAADVLSGLAINAIDSQVQVEFGSHMGQDGTVLCNEVHVTSVVPCEADGTTAGSK